MVFTLVVYWDSEACICIVDLSRRILLSKLHFHLDIFRLVVFKVGVCISCLLLGCN